jgi:hypothetical protein
MTKIQTYYPPGRYGLGTEFAESRVPLEYLSRFQNRFININGDAEKRQGIAQLGDTITGQPTITGLHEFISKDGTATLFASADGKIWSLNETTGAWTQVQSGKDMAQRLLSVQMNDKHIFFNGSDRNFFTDNAGSSFQELQALISRGQISSSAASATSLTDSNVPNWLQSTFVNVNDLVYNSTLNGYGIVTSVGAGNITHTTIGSAASGLGSVSRNQQSGDFYQIVDLVELNIIPQNSDKDNFTIAGSGTSTTQIQVSGLDFSQTDIRAGDYVYNTTRAAVSKVNSVSANITVTTVASQTANDSIQFFKSAMPISSWIHVHYARAYHIDSRDPNIVRISGPNDPQDMTTFQRNLQAGTSFYGSRQPQAERLLCIKTFQRFLVAAGERNVYADSGVNPIQDTTAATTDFAPIGLFPQGSVSRFALESIGGTMNFAANDGVRNFSANFDANAFQTSNVSESIKSELASAIESQSSAPDEIQLVHYPRRNWLMCKIGDVIYNYNYTPFYAQGQINTNPYGSFSKFTGKFAEQKTFLVRRNGDLVCAGAGGKVYEFDKGSYSDDGPSIETIMETGWIKLNEAQESTQTKSIVYIKVQFETGEPITYTINATGDTSELSTDSVTTQTDGVGQIGFARIGVSPIGGRRIFDEKLPLRGKGQEFKIRISTNDSNGPDIVSGFTLYGNITGIL